MLGRSHFKLVTIEVGARDLLDCIVVPVTRNHYSYSLLLLIVLIRQFSVIHSVLFIVQILLHFHLESINIIQQTPLTLS